MNDREINQLLRDDGEIAEKLDDLFAYVFTLESVGHGPTILGRESEGLSQVEMMFYGRDVGLIFY